ncbi:hypothetical protein SELMODRAFT_438363 [Selaginella moellendorffii]|uniref:TRAF-type domain-containing protein n=2 Tax=Selaginella moellendorffii TaxID=88036 RepID=D8QXF1_SELML|nr:hypothetical protein SELMODRAFT_438363 [Selaginella moellendorffii]
MALHPFAEANPQQPTPIAACLPQLMKEDLQHAHHHHHHHLHELERMSKIPINGKSAWTDAATDVLIDVFEEKWNSLRRGNLKAKNWDEVGAELGNRCGVPKTGDQCRHKIEKLRGKFRQEKVVAVLGQSKWPWYDRLNMMFGGGGGGAAGGGGNNANDKASADAKSSQEHSAFHRHQHNSHVVDEDGATATTTAPASGKSTDRDETASPRSKSGGGGSRKRGRESSSSDLGAALKYLSETLIKIEECKVELQRDNERLGFVSPKSLDRVKGDLAMAGEEEQKSVVVEEKKEEEELSPIILQECGYYDVEQLHKATGLLLLTLAAACVEKTIGDPFNQPGSVVGDLKRELIESLESQSQQYAGAALGSLSDRVQAPKPMKILQGFLDGFVRSKANLLARVSSRILSNDKKEDKIEEFVGELDRSGAWMVGRREMLARSLLRRIDRSMVAHCEMRFGSSEELAAHKARCALRPTTCTNEGCTDVYSAVQGGGHDARCAFKVLTCEQGCGQSVARADMDRHCVSVCPMKMVTCPFHHVGCVDRLPQGTVEVHCAGNVSSHLLAVLHVLQRLEVGIASQSQRISNLEKALSKAQVPMDDDAAKLELEKIKEESRTLEIPAVDVSKLTANH